MTICVTSVSIVYLNRKLVNEKIPRKTRFRKFPKCCRKGIKIVNNQKVNAVSGYERLYRLFWNKKAEELSRNPSFAKWDKTAITMVIVTQWSLKKTALLLNHATRLMDHKPTTSENKKQIQIGRAHV